jgi:hypothetical protein
MFHNCLPLPIFNFFLCLLTIYIIIIQGYHPTNLILFLNQKKIMVCDLTLYFQGLKYGILLITKSRPYPWIFLKNVCILKATKRQQLMHSLFLIILKVDSLFVFSCSLFFVEFVFYTLFRPTDQSSYLIV